MEVNIDPIERVIVALDFPTQDEALCLVDMLNDLGVFYKVGLELFLNTGGSILKELKKRDKKIFLDLKFHDIPNTVFNAAKWANTLDVDIFNVHALGGKKMMETAKSVFEGQNDKKLIAVTILTSMSNNDLIEIGIDQELNQSVLDLAGLAHSAHLDGVVCSAREASQIKNLYGQSFITVCPGIRPLWASQCDQTRIMTPKEAILAGVDYMVIGRPITQATSPRDAMKKIIEEIKEVI